MLQLGGLFAKYFYPEKVPKAEFIKNFLRGYHEEANKLKNIQIEHDEFELIIDAELRNILVVMLSIRVQMIQRCLFHNFLYPGKLSLESVKHFCFSLYDDYLQKKDEQLGNWQESDIPENEDALY